MDECSKHWNCINEISWWLVSYWTGDGLLVNSKVEYFMIWPTTSLCARSFISHFVIIHIQCGPFIWNSWNLCDVLYLIKFRIWNETKFSFGQSFVQTFWRKKKCHSKSILFCMNCAKNNSITSSFAYSKGNEYLQSNCDGIWVRLNAVCFYQNSMHDAKLPLIWYYLLSRDSFSIFEIFYFFSFVFVFRGFQCVHEFRLKYKSIT